MSSTAVPIANSRTDLTPEWFTRALRAGDTLDATAQVTAAHVQPLGNGQVGQVLQAELTYAPPNAGPRSLVAKIPAELEGRRQMAIALGVYDTEVRFYEQIASRLDTPVPRLYASALEPGTGRFTLLLEDLSDQAQAGDTVAGATIEQATAALDALPGLQAPLWNSPQLLDDPFWGDDARSRVIFEMVPATMPLVEERFGSLLEPEHLEVVRWLASVADRAFAQVWHPPFVVAHGDYRLDNMLFGTAPGAPTVSLIDWQGARLAPPLVDAAMFLGPNLEPSLRREQEQSLLERYHRRLVDAGVQDFSFEACWRSYRLCTLYPLAGALTAGPALAQTDRDTQVWASILRNCAQMAIDLQTRDLIA